MEQTISHSLSYTFKIGDNQWIKVNAELVGIDINSPIEGQLEKYDVALSESWKFLFNKVDSEINDIINAANKVNK